MKVLAINGSPRKAGNTNEALSIVAEELQGAGIETEIVWIGNEPLQGCTGCGVCGKHRGRCAYDDVVNECLDKMQACDGLLIGSPVYYASIAGSMKCFLDRFFFAGAPVPYKVGAGVAVLRRSGAVTTFDHLNHYYQLQNMLIVPSFYWNAVHGASPGEIRQDSEGIDILRNVGRNMAWLMQMLAYAKDAVPHPAPQPRTRTNFVR